MQLSGYQVTLRDIQAQDLEMIRAWRNDPDVRRFMLSQELISEEQQRAWFSKIRQKNCQQHWLMLYKEQPIGVANIRTLVPAESLDSATLIEPGLYIADPRYRGNILAFAPTLLMNDYCFYTLGVKQLKAKVKADNQAALKYNQRLGYRVEKDGELVEISLTEDDYRHHAAPIKALLNR